MNIAGCDYEETPEEGKVRVLEQARDYKRGNGGRKHGKEIEEGKWGEEEAGAEIEDREKAAVVMAARCSYTSGGCNHARWNAGIENRDKWPCWGLVGILEAVAAARGVGLGVTTGANTSSPHSKVQKQIQPKERQAVGLRISSRACSTRRLGNAEAGKYYGRRRVGGAQTVV